MGYRNSPFEIEGCVWAGSPMPSPLVISKWQPDIKTAGPNWDLEAVWKSSKHNPQKLPQRR